MTLGLGKGLAGQGAGSTPIARSPGGVAFSLPRDPLCYPKVSLRWGDRDSEFLAWPVLIKSVIKRDER